MVSVDIQWHDTFVEKVNLQLTRVEILVFNNMVLDRRVHVQDFKEYSYVLSAPWLLNFLPNARTKIRPCAPCASSKRHFTVTPRRQRQDSVAASWTCVSLVMSGARDDGEAPLMTSVLRYCLITCTHHSCILSPDSRTIPHSCRRLNHRTII